MIEHFPTTVVRDEVGFDRRDVSVQRVRPHLVGHRASRRPSLASMMLASRAPPRVPVPVPSRTRRPTPADASTCAFRTGGGTIVPVGPFVTALDHVQLAMPAGREAEAEVFYCGILGLEVRQKPPVLAARGGRWFARGEVQVHLGVEEDFRPARKAHPGLRVAEFDDLLATLDAHGVGWKADADLPGVRRIYVEDPFGNRLELIEADAGETIPAR